MKCVIDGTTIQDRAQLHDLLAKTLCLPEWYGRNLDALHDVLMDCFEDTFVEVIHFSQLHETFGRYADSLKRVLEQCAQENSHITVFFEA